MDIKKPKHQQSVTEGPSHFLSIRIENPSIINKIEELQSSIECNAGHLKRHSISTKKIHLTLFVLHLHDQQTLDRAVDTLKSCQMLINELRSEVEAAHITLKGLSHFNNRVLYIDIENDEHLKRLINVTHAIRQQFLKAGLVDRRERFKLTPHITIYKIRREKVKRETPERQRFESTCFEEHKDLHFGSQPIACIELSEMKAVDPDGFYKCVHSISINNTNNTEKY